MPYWHALAIIWEESLVGSMLALLFGILLIAGGISGRRFTTGLSGKTAVSPWYGRTWLIGNGLFLLAGGIVGALEVIHPTASLLGGARFWENAQDTFYAVFESYNGVGIAIFGLIASVHLSRKRNWKWFWLCLALAVGGSILGYDGILNLIKGR